MEDDLLVIDRPGVAGKPMTLKQLPERPVVVREEGSGTRREAERILQAAGVDLEKLQVAAILGSTEAVKHGVQAGLGWSVVSRRAVEAELAAGSLREVPLKGLRLRRSFHLVTHGRRTLPAPYRAFVDTCFRGPLIVVRRSVEARNRKHGVRASVFICRG
jgi:DNA-binding transcriptional LysR family regulator